MDNIRYKCYVDGSLVEQSDDGELDHWDAMNMVGRWRDLYPYSVVSLFEENSITDSYRQIVSYGEDI